MAKDKEQTRQRRKAGLRKRITGTTDRPRLSVFRSNKHIYAQVIDDAGQSAIASLSTSSKALQADLKGKSKVEGAELVGMALGKACLEKGVKTIVFDRNGFIYHGRVKALADAAREAGLEF
jgi:large subunit ribosomal protein L18